MIFQRCDSAAFIGALKCMYSPRNLHIQLILYLYCKSLEASYPSDLNVDGNVHYTSECCMQELLQCLSDTVAEPIISHLHCISLLFL